MNYKNYCLNCKHYDKKYGACYKFHINVRDYENNFIKKCNGEYFSPLSGKETVINIKNVPKKIKSSQGIKNKLNNHRKLNVKNKCYICKKNLGNLYSSELEFQDYIKSEGGIATTSRDVYGIRRFTSSVFICDNCLEKHTNTKKLILKIIGIILMTICLGSIIIGLTLLNDDPEWKESLILIGAIIGGIGLIPLLGYFNFSSESKEEHGIDYLQDLVDKWKKNKKCEICGKEAEYKVVIEEKEGALYPSTVGYRCAEHTNGFGNIYILEKI